MALLHLSPTPSHCMPFVNTGPLNKPMLSIGLLNLMPDKAATEVQWLRLLQQARSPLPLNVSLLKFTDWQTKRTSPLYMSRYYRNVEDALHSGQLDALIVTGAPLGQLDYQQVAYWPAFTHLACELHVRGVPTFYSCWAANAALYHLHRTATLRSSAKLSGLFMQTVSPHPLTNALADKVSVPQSRYSRPDSSQLNPSIKTLLQSEQTGPTLLFNERNLDVFLLGHVEYDADTLAKEYQRDQQKGMAVTMPEGYFIDNDPTQLPPPQWQQTGSQLLGNWLGMLSAGLRPAPGPALHQQ